MREESLIRGIGRRDLVAIVINTVIGAGIFGLPSAVAKLIGSYSIVAFFGCSVLIALFALCFAEVASRFRKTGGSYLYSRRAFGKFIGFETGWLFWMTRITAFAANCNLLVSYTGYFYSPLSQGVLRVAIISTVVLGLTYINVVGIEDTVRANNVLTIGKLSPLFLFAVVGIFFIDPSNFSFGPLPEAGVFAKATLALIYAFVGFESAVIPAGEIKDPRKNAPFGLLSAIGVIVALYIIVQTVAIGTLPDLAGSERPLADAAQRFIGPVGAGVIVVGAIISILGNLNTGVLAASRLLFAMSERKDVPFFISATHERFRTPYVAISLTMALCFLLSVFSTFVSALTISTVTRLFVYALTFVTLFVFRRKPEFADTDGFKVPAGELVAAVSIALIAVLFYFVSYSDLIQLGGAAAIGAGLFFGYWLWKRNTSEPAAP